MVFLLSFPSLSGMSVKAPLLVISVSVSISRSGDLPITGIRTGSFALEEEVLAVYKLYSPGIYAACISPTATVGKRISSVCPSNTDEVSTMRPRVTRVLSCAFPPCTILVMLDKELVLLKNL